MKYTIPVLLAISSLLLASEFVIGEQTQPGSDPFCGS
jgi:hypothetical protein